MFEIGLIRARWFTWPWNFMCLLFFLPANGLGEKDGVFALPLHRLEGPQ